MTSTSATFLSSTQLAGIADKLTSADDRQKYRHLISLSSSIQAKLNQMRLERMNAVTISSVDSLELASVYCQELDRQNGPVVTQQNDNQLIEGTTDKKDGVPRAHRQSHDLIYPTSFKDSPAIYTPPSTAPPTPSTTIMPTLPEIAASPPPPLPLLENAPTDNEYYLSTKLERHDSAVQVAQDEYTIFHHQDKELPAFPDYNRHDSVYDPYYYEEQHVDLSQYPLPKTIQFAASATQLNVLPVFKGNALPPSSSGYNPVTGNHINSSFLLITPPASPRYIDHSSSSADCFPLSGLLKNLPLPLPPIIHVHKKINGFLGLLTRTYQLNEIISSRTVISPLGLFNAIDSLTGQAKAVLKLTMTSTQVKDIDEQDSTDTLDNDMLNLFGFTFYASFKRSPNVKRPHREDPYCLVVSDHIVSSALDYWVQHQRDDLPALTFATHILKESVKIYVIYDKVMFPNV